MASLSPWRTVAPKRKGHDGKPGAAVGQHEVLGLPTITFGHSSQLGWVEHSGRGNEHGQRSLRLDFPHSQRRGAGGMRLSAIMSPLIADCLQRICRGKEEFWHLEGISEGKITNGSSYNLSFHYKHCLFKTHISLKYATNLVPPGTSLNGGRLL